MIYSVLVLGGIGLVMGIFLAFASKKFEVKIDPNVEKLLDILPGSNCGACGFPGCVGYAEAIITENADPTLCSPGGSDVANSIGKIIGVESNNIDLVKKVARIKCQGDNSKTTKIFSLDTQIKTCISASLYFGGDKSCWHGCLGYGDCMASCPVNAIQINSRGIAVINEESCISCGKCVKECPKNLIEMFPETQKITVLCSSKSKGIQARNSCAVACVACNMCVKTCPVDAIQITNNLAKIDSNKCINCGLCSIKCPTNAIINDIKEIKKARIIESKCIGCTACLRVCPIECISGKVKEKHVINEEDCIGCGLCYDKCKFNAIELNVSEIKR